MTTSSIPLPARICSIAMFSLSAVFLSAGCGSLPSSGPSISGIKSGADREKVPGNYLFIPVSQDVLDAIRSKEVSGTSGGLSSLSIPTRPSPSKKPKGVHKLGNAADQKIAKGDMVNVTIFTSGGGLFADVSESTLNGRNGAMSNSSTQLPPQIVDHTGEITVPHIGRVKALGLSAFEVQEEITKRLKPKAIMPWTLVTVGERHGGDLVTITGDVKQPKRTEIPLAGLRVIDAITAAGGSTAQEYETTVTVMRGTQARSELLGDIHRDPKQNITLEPGDTIVLQARPWSYTSLGATGQKRNHFLTQEINLAEAIGGSGGLNDNQANPEAVFIYRFESPETLERLGRSAGPVTKSGAPVVYQVNLRSPNGIFLASQFGVRDKDVLFVGNAGTVGLIKAAGVFNAMTSPIIQGTSTATGIGTISALNKN